MKSCVSVENIQKAADKLAELVPEARIAIGHGQMRERELERVMNDFHHQRFNVLVCTTIIETGIDIPTANTIIIERADHFGLAQLHQLRGRVGRSHHQAYAWLLTPHPKAMTTDAQKRLEAIASLEDLGAGFALATHDLEIRGAGELLGEDQSGQMETIGFSLYMELLENAVDALKAGREPSLEDLTSQQTEVELRMPSLLPDDFIPDVNTRLSFYKRIASAKNEQDLEEIKVELIDRFGRLPDAARNLLDIARLRQQAQKLGIRKLESNEKGGVIEFNEKNNVNPVWLIGGIMQSGALLTVLLALSTLTTGILQGLGEMQAPLVHAATAVAIHLGFLVLFVVKFKWNIYGVVYANIIFGLIICLLNARSIRKKLHYRQEIKKTFLVPVIAAGVMGIAAYLVHRVFNLFAGNTISTILAVCVGAIVYGICLVKLGGILEREIRRLPKGDLLADLLIRLNIL